MLTQGDTPIVAVASHDGHDVRFEVAAVLELSEADRWREEDPFTAIWVRLADTQIVVKRSLGVRCQDSGGRKRNKRRVRNFMTNMCA